MKAAKGCLDLLISRRQLDGQKGEQQDPQGAVEHDWWSCVAEEQPDPEHDAGDRDRCGGKRAEDMVSRK